MATAVRFPRNSPGVALFCSKRKREIHQGSPWESGKWPAARDVMAGPGMRRSPSDLRIIHPSIVKYAEAWWLSHRHSPHGKRPSFKYCQHTWCSGAPPATLLRLMEIVSSQLTNFKPDCAACQARMRHARSGNPNIRHNNERVQEKGCTHRNGKCTV